MSDASQKPLALLAPLDGSHLAEAVLPTLCQLARRLSAPVILLHIVEEKPPATVHGERHLTGLEEATHYLDKIADRLRGEGIQVETHVHGPREGDVARSIGDHHREMGVQLVVLCTHGRGGWRGLLFGSIAQKVLQRGSGPILLIPSRGVEAPPVFDIHRILVPVDGTPDHEPALEQAVALAELFDAELRLVLVIPTLRTLRGGDAATGLLLPRTMRAVLDLAEQGAAEYLQDVVERCGKAGIVARGQVARGDPAPVILDLAEKIPADLIVAATHGRAGLDAILNRSVSARVAEGVACPIWLVRVPDSPDTATDGEKARDGD
ncbi:MAG: universal stress protein [Anaerolineae bacterium]